MDLDSGAIYSIQQWLEYEMTPSMRVAIHRDVKMSERFDLTRPIFETVTVERDIFKRHEWVVEFAARLDNHLPVMYGKPMLLADYYDKRARY